MCVCAYRLCATKVVLVRNDSVATASHAVFPQAAASSLARSPKSVLIFENFFKLADARASRYRRSTAFSDS